MKLNPMEIEINSSFKFKVMYFAGALMHVVFFVLFSICKINIMMIFNIFSVIIYFAGAIAAGRKHYDKYAFGWLLVIYAEITLHGMLATFILGTDAAFFLYMMMVLPIGAYMLFFACDRRLFWNTILIMTIVTMIALFVTLTIVNERGTLIRVMYGRTLTATETNIMRGINVIFTTLMIASYSIIFIMEIIALINRLNDTNEKLTYTATHDALTGLYNRHSLRRFFSELESSNQPFCVMLGDIDDFKKVNDTYGHDCGDLVLKTVAEIISGEMMSGDLACRWGGEELLLIFRGSRTDCFSRAKIVRQKIIERKITHEGKTISVTMTFGFVDNNELSEPPAEGISKVEALISLADKRLYKGKTSGKNVIISKN